MKSIKEYLHGKGVDCEEKNGELITRCIFNGCDDDSRSGERHLYINAKTGAYQCKKCGAAGSRRSLKLHFDDENTAASPSIPRGDKQGEFNRELVRKYHKNLPARIRTYLNKRGISDEFIDQSKIGYAKIHRKNWITIPITNREGEYIYLKLRRDPDDGDEKITYPRGASAQIYGWDTLKETAEEDTLTVCEGELDRLALLSVGIPAITSTHGAGTFKGEWIPEVMRFKKIVIVYDNDEAGRKGAARVAEMLRKAGASGIYIADLPSSVGVGGDVTDYLLMGNSVFSLYTDYARPYPEPIDVSQFSPMTLDDVARVLGRTIKRDDSNKMVTFLIALSAYTPDAQLNGSFMGPSSTGKSHIPLEIAKYFPREDVMELGGATPTAFFHSKGEYDKETNTVTVDMERKVIVFLEQPHTELLTKIRALLSHDQKLIHHKITDKSERFGHRTKEVVLKGFPSVIFCTAGLNIDQQEATRFIILTPEFSQEKIRDAICESITKESDTSAYQSRLDNDPERALLIKRILAIKYSGVTEILVPYQDAIRNRFLDAHGILKPRHQRDIKRVLSLIKCIALFNVWWRERNGSSITANESDVAEAFRIWDAISVYQEHDLPPYIYNIYRDVIIPSWNKRLTDECAESVEDGETRKGLTIQDIAQGYYDVYGSSLNIRQLEKDILPMLERAGLIFREPDKHDKRRRLIYPTLRDTIVGGDSGEEADVDSNDDGPKQ